MASKAARHRRRAEWRRRLTRKLRGAIPIGTLALEAMRMFEGRLVKRPATERVYGAHFD